jgi:hypothetical protein
VLDPGHARLVLTALRSLILVAIAMLAIFVVLPAALFAAGT